MMYPRKQNIGFGSLVKTFVVVLCLKSPHVDNGGNRDCSKVGRCALRFISQLFVLRVSLRIGNWESGRVRTVTESHKIYFTKMLFPCLEKNGA